MLSPACKPLGEAHDRAVKLAIAGYAVGGLLAAGSIVLFIMSSKRRFRIPLHEGRRGGHRGSVMTSNA